MCWGHLPLHKYDDASVRAIEVGDKLFFTEKRKLMRLGTIQAGNTIDSCLRISVPFSLQEFGEFF
jgi:hypothetical protein